MRVLCVRFSSPPGVARRLERKLQGLAPVLEKGGQGVFYIDIDGLEQHTFIDRVRAVCESHTAGCSMGVAGGRFSALTAAALAGRGGLRVIPPGADSSFLGGLSIDILPISESDRLTLTDAGIRTVGELSSTDPRSLRRRFGDKAMTWLALAGARKERPLRASRKELSISTTVFFDEPIAERPRLIFALLPALESLLSSLASAGRGLKALGVKLYFDNDSDWRGRVALAEATVQPKVVMDGLRAIVKRLEAAVVGADLYVLDDVIPDGQAHLFAPPGRGGPVGLLASIMGALGSLAGSFGMGRFSLTYGRLPEENWTLVPWGGRCPKNEPPCRKGVIRRRGELPGTTPSSSTLTLRLLPEPRPICVELDENEAPVLIDGGPVLDTAGPFRLSQRWWKGETGERLYFDVLLPDGLAMWIFQRDRQWFLQGIYD